MVGYSSSSNHASHVLLADLCIMNIGVERIGQINVDFSRMDKSKVPQRRGGRFGRRIYNLQFSVVVEFGSRTGVLELKTVFEGVVFGTATISFD